MAHEHDSSLPSDIDDPLATHDPFESYDPENAELLATVAPEEAGSTEQDTDTIGATPPVAIETLGEVELSKISNVCDSFASAWEQGDSEPSVQEYVPKDWDGSLRLSLARELVLLDIEQRRKKNKSLPPTEYLSALPDCRSAVESALAAGKTTVPRGYGKLTVPSAKVQRQKAQLQHPDDPTSRYRPTKFHARGGLGAVFSAEDTELKRVVALKEVLLEHSENQRIQDKFVFEAEITGSLEHPGIVPVYGLGRYEDNQPYYAMRFIRGDSFRKKIEQFHEQNKPLTAGVYFSREFRALLRRLIDSCNAIHYAHEHGVLHRDIKPDNIMIGDYGETLVVDWGLAKLISTESQEQQPTHVATKIAVTGTGSKTSHGSAVGTPIFMSPEQAHGLQDELDGRTDVYSLGAMLFNIATGAYAIEGNSVLEIVRKVRDGKIRSPKELVPSLPGALDSICRKSMATDPKERYSTAVELADDIDRWMNDDIVVAHQGHETVVERAGRLIRRYRSWTISGAAALLTITIVAIISTLVINRAKTNEQIAKQQAIGFKQDAVARYQDSRNAIDTWLVQSSDALQFFPGTQAVRKRLLQLATEDYERLAAIESGDPSLELERGRALAKLGDLHRMQQAYEAAIEHYTQASQLFDFDIEIDDPTIANSFRVEHGNVQTRIGLVLADQDEMVEAEQAFNQAIEELTTLTLTSRNDDAIRRLAVAHVDFGETLVRRNEFDNAIEQLEQGIEIYASLGESADATSTLATARAQELLGRVFIRQGEHATAMQVLDTAIASLLRLVEAEPDHPDYLDALASAYITQATSFRDRGLETELLQTLRQAATHYRELDAAIPDVPQYQSNLGLTLTDIGLALYEQGESPRAEERLNEADAILTSLYLSYPQVPRFRENLATCWDAMGQVHWDIKEDLSESRLLLEDAVKLFKKLMINASPEQTPGYIERTAVVLSHYARVLDRQDAHEDAAGNFGKAISMLEELVEFEGESPAYLNALAHVHYRFALSLHGQESELANEHFRIARTTWESIDSAPASYRHDLAWMLVTCPDPSIRDVEAALVHAREAVNLAAGNANYVSTNALAMVLADQSEGAIELLERSKVSRGDWIDRDLFVLAMARHDLGQTDAATQALQEGRQWNRDHRPFHEDMNRLHEMAESYLASKEN